MIIAFAFSIMLAGMVATLEYMDTVKMVQGSGGGLAASGSAVAGSCC